MWELALEMMVLLVVANAAPIIAARVMRSAAQLPVDCGYRLADGRPLFGASKTWRGIGAAMLLCALVGPLLGYSLGFSTVFAGLAMAGDLLSSFIKRRRGLESSDQLIGVDQLPEAILPGIFAVVVTELQWWWAIVLPTFFLVLELLVSRPLYHLKIRKRPY